MSVEVKGVTEKQGVNVITFEITALYNVKATTAGKNETMQEEGTGRNTILIGTAIPQKVGTRLRSPCHSRQIIRPRISLSAICFIMEELYIIL